MRKNFLYRIFRINQLNKGGVNAGTLYVIVIMVAITSFAFFLNGGNLFTPPSFPPLPENGPGGTQEIVFNQVQDPGKKNLQLQTFTVKNLPTPTPSCLSQIAVDFLIDISGSMAFGDKQAKEKEALSAFTQRMGDTSVIGIQTFSRGAQENVPISLYKDVKPQVQATINSLTASGNTETRTGLTLSKQKLQEAISQNKFPGYKYSLVFITDGVPETTNPNEQDCIATATRDDGYRRCFARAQDPRVPTNLGTEIKDLGVDVYSISITSQEGSDVALQPHLDALLQNIASQPLATHYYTSLNGGNLNTILDNVLNTICQEQP